MLSVTGPINSSSFPLFLKFAMLLNISFNPVPALLPKMLLSFSLPSIAYNVSSGMSSCLAEVPAYLNPSLNRSRSAAVFFEVTAIISVTFIASFPESP